MYLYKFAVILYFIAVVRAAQQDVLRDVVKTGRYNPQLHGASGKYMPDNRGKYQHIPVPYDGGYGDRGEKYTHDDDSRLRYWQQNEGEEGTWEKPDVYEKKAPYAALEYLPARSSMPNYVPQNLQSDVLPTYAEDYKHDVDGWRIIQFKWIRDGKTRYSFYYETENKILAQEIGKLINLCDNSSAINVDGFYQYEGDDGTIYEVDYVANENGFFPKGKHIDKSILNVLNFLLKNTTRVWNPSRI